MIFPIKGNIRNMFLYSFGVEQIIDYGHHHWIVGLGLQWVGCRPDFAQVATAHPDAQRRLAHEALPAWFQILELRVCGLGFGASV